MPWIVGIDEAGYGPNLGPLSQAAVAVKLPDGDAVGWPTLATLLRRHGDKDKTRLLVDDSKLVHSGKHGFARLEHGMTGLLGLKAGTTFGGWLGEIALDHVVTDLQREAWFDADLALPLMPEPTADLTARLAALGVEVRVVGVKLVPTPVFNTILAAAESKATVLTVGLVGLLAAIRERLPAGEPVEVHVDKIGGRNAYGHVVSGAFPDGWTVTEHESLQTSRYRVESLGRDLAIEFRPEADKTSLAVALASMLAKYLREVSMRQFNAYWHAQRPGLKPTAGYPVDAKRFFDEIRPLLPRLDLTESAVWRLR